MKDPIIPKNYIILLQEDVRSELYEAIYEFTIDWFKGYGGHQIIEVGDTILVTPRGKVGPKLRLIHLFTSDPRHEAEEFHWGEGE